MGRVEEAYQRTGSFARVEEAMAEGRPASAAALERYPREGGPASSRPPVAAGRFDDAPPAVSLERPGRADGLSITCGHLVTAGADVAPTEQYSRLAASLHDAQMEQGIRTLMVTSALPREGKTLTAVNLAITFSELYSRRVLLIDADLRRPSVHEVLKVRNQIGLGEVLRSGQDLQGPLPVTNITARLSVLLAGHPDASPVAALASTRMKGVIEDARALFDWVILDSPPVGLLPDANLIARWVDGVLLVIAARVTPYRAVKDALAQLGPERVLGSVLNRAEQLPMDYGNYYSSSSHSAR